MMEQGHGNLGEWHHNQNVSGWDESQFSSADLGYNHDAQNEYGIVHNNSFGGGTAGLEHSMSGTEGQSLQAYPNFPTYGAQHASPWSEQGQSSPEYSQQNLMGSGAYGDYRICNEASRPAASGNGTHFHYADVSRNNQFTNQAQVRNRQAQLNVNGRMVGGFQNPPASRISWQQTDVSNANGFENAASFNTLGAQSSAPTATQTRLQTASPSPYPSHPAQATDGVQQHVSQHTIPAVSQARLAPVAEAQSSQNRIPQQQLQSRVAAAQPIIQVKPSPSAGGRATTHASPQVSERAHTSSSSLPGTSIHLPPLTAASPSVAQPQVSQIKVEIVAASRPIEPSTCDNDLDSGMQRNAEDASRVFVEHYLRSDPTLLGRAQEQMAGSFDSDWKGVAHLVEYDEEETCNVPERMTRQPMLLKGSKTPLFNNPRRGFPWTPAELLGNHLNQYLAVPRDDKYDVDRQKLDAILDVAMKRADKAIPENWWTSSIPGEAKKRKLADWKDVAPKRLGPPTDRLVALEHQVYATLDPWSSHLDINEQHKRMIVEDYGKILADRMTKFKESEAFQSLTKAFVERRKKGPSQALNDKINRLKRDLHPIREQVRVVVDQGLAEARPATLSAVGEVRGVMVALFNTLNRLLNIRDGKSPLVMSVLRLLTKCTTVTPDQLDSYKFTAESGKISAKSQLDACDDDEIRQMVTQIEENAAKNEDSDTSKATTTKEAKKAAKPAKNGTSTGTTAATKRPREDDTEARTSKKMATHPRGTGSPSAADDGASLKAASSLVIPGAANTGAAKASVPATIDAAKARASMLLPGKARPATIIKPVSKPLVKPEWVKNDPGSSSTTPKAPVPSKTEVKAQATRASAPAKSASTRSALPPAKAKVPDAPLASQSVLSSLLADIAEPKKVVAKTTCRLTPESAVAETNVERERRLRKEQRRKLGLRVRFKSDERLVEIREFQSEEGKHRRTRDFKSSGKDKMEGMALKQGHTGEMRPWDEPSAVDFDTIPAAKRAETFATRGGDQDGDMAHREMMDERDKTEIMVIYTDPSDIPSTPKSPTLGCAAAVSEEVGVPEYQVPNTARFFELRQRQRDSALYGEWRAIFEATKRLEQDASGHPAATHDGAFPSRALEDPGVIHQRDQQTADMLESILAKQYRDPKLCDANRPWTRRRQNHDDRRRQEAADQVEKTVAQKKTEHEEKPDSHPAWMRDPERIEQWYQAKNQHKSMQLDPQPVDVQMGDMGVPVVSATAAVAPQSALAPVPPVAPFSQAQASPQDYSHVWAAYYAQQGHEAYAQQVQTYGQTAPIAAQGPQPYPNLAGAQTEDTAQLEALVAALGGAPNAEQPATAHTPASTDAVAQMEALVSALNSASGVPPHSQPVGQPNAEYLASLMQWAVGQAGASQPPAQEQLHQAPGGKNGPLHDSMIDYARLGEDRCGYSNNIQNNSSNSTSNWDRDLERDRDRENGGEGGGRQRKRYNNRNKQENDDGDDEKPEHLKGIKTSLIGTKQCIFWLKGTCNKGEKCTFRHD